MKKLAFVLGGVFTVLLATGCTTPAKVCDHLKSLDALPVGGQVGCEIKWGKAKSDNPDQYKKEAECVLAAKSKEEVSKCK